MRYVVAYLATGIAFLAIDSIWLMTMADRLYRPLLGDLLTETFNVVPAILFYIIYIAGIVIFAVRPAWASGRWKTAALFGALFGFCAYATYDLTNQATIKDWPALITVADLCWGTVLSALAATVGFVATRRFVR
ncbi:MAG: DUF2177 family protein [Hyphomicrobiales bacterium]|nr:DUF2177 family protein [Hyphomicrobiales bacterium]